MRRYLLAVLLFALPCCGQIVLKHKASATPTTVTFGIDCGFGGGALHVSCNLGGTPATGDAVLVNVYLYTTTDTVNSICDGTGTDGCTGSSTYTLETAVTNGSNFKSYVGYTCNYVGTGTGTITVNQSGTGGIYGLVMTATGNTTTGTNCKDGYTNTVNTSAGTSCTTPTITTTNAHDLLAGFTIASGGYGTYTVGADGQGNTFTARDAQAGVITSQTINETAANTYYSAGTWTTSSVNTCSAFAVK